MKTLLAALCLAAGLPAAAAEPANFVQWRTGLASSAQPDRDWLAKVRDLKYDVVVNLAPPQSQGSLRDEGGIVGAAGATYVNIPVNWDAPTAEDFRFFSEVLKANAGRSVLVHCQVNMRGSSFTFLYRVIHENAPAAEARDKLIGVWMPNAVWRRFIEQTLAAHGKAVEIF